MNMTIDIDLLSEACNKLFNSEELLKPDQIQEVMSPEGAFFFRWTRFSPWLNICKWTTDDRFKTVANFSANDQRENEVVFLDELTDAEIYELEDFCKDIIRTVNSIKLMTINK